MQLVVLVVNENISRYVLLSVNMFKFLKDIKLFKFLFFDHTAADVFQFRSSDSLNLSILNTRGN